VEHSAGVEKFGIESGTMVPTKLCLARLINEASGPDHVSTISRNVSRFRLTLVQVFHTR
jgi:hypothetical protein